MCKVNPPRLGCPHLPLSVCRNRQNHPRFDVVHFRNAELSLFNGCGYCKWARKHPHSSNDRAFLNTGWPGCCRPPKLSEHGYLKDPSEWVAVSIIHNVPIPSDIAIPLGLPSVVTSGSMRSSNSVRKTSATTAKPTLAIPDRDKNRERTPPARDSSPLQHTLPLLSPASSSPPSSSHAAAAAPAGTTPLSADVARTPNRKMTKLPGEPSEKRPDIAVRTPDRILPSFPSPSTPRIQVSENRPSPKASREPTEGRDLLTVVSPTLTRRATMLEDLTNMSDTSGSTSGSESCSSSGAVSSVIASTVVSDGFTDYLSDESDQELQRQAEARAIELENTRAENAEFTAALQTVRDLSLQPPPEWNPSLTVTRAKPHRHSTISTFSGSPNSIAIAVGQSSRH
ncbi:hypothetical protein SISSUDRAFT_1040938 [Sistotremastrum suecicum HHB10207 ss-3]|uniref:Uncharacterized protein n=1 Tax=Sistotremastrum suecicum HHB10207 ss-3 TaxID=1314776 RepID=A0A166HSH9_9AGAM|nr:hypothetical protein SISSUDRAFT_1040938 [Sistotremastrum suecicum HHB10207 ss-3]